jgi:hypothetical protein
MSADVSEELRKDVPDYVATRLLSGLKCEVMLHHAESSLQRLIILVSFV